MAIERIYKRISDTQPEVTYRRNYWLHLHEHEEVLQLLNQKFRQTLKVAQKKTFFNIVEIDTSRCDEEAVAGLISEFSKKYYQRHPFERWTKIG